MLKKNNLRQPETDTEETSKSMYAGNMFQWTEHIAESKEFLNSNLGSAMCS